MCVHKNCMQQVSRVAPAIEKSVRHISCNPLWRVAHSRARVPNPKSHRITVAGDTRYRRRSTQAFSIDRLDACQPSQSQSIPHLALFTYISFISFSVLTHTCTISVYSRSRRRSHWDIMCRCVFERVSSCETADKYCSGQVNIHTYTLIESAFVDTYMPLTSLLCGLENVLPSSTNPRSCKSVCDR